MAGRSFRQPIVPTYYIEDCQILRHHASIIRVHTGFYLSLSLCDYILIWVSSIIQHILKNGRILVFRTFPPHYWTGKKVRRKTGFRLRWHSWKFCNNWSFFLKFLVSFSFSLSFDTKMTGIKSLNNLQKINSWMLKLTKIIIVSIFFWKLSWIVDWSNL